MSSPSILSPIPLAPAATLAPPSSSSRPSSASSSRSNSSRRSKQPRKKKGGESSASISRSNSHSSADGSDSRAPSTDGSRGGRTPKIDQRNGQKSDQSKGKKIKKDDGSAKATPIPIGTPKGSSPQPDPTPRSLKAVSSPPRTAMDAAMDAAKAKHGGDALQSLQKMISDLKTMPPPPVPLTTGGSVSSGSSAAGSRSASGTKEASRSPPPSHSPLIIPSAGSRTLKADAPTFTPSLRTTVSPISVSPTNIPQPIQQNRSMSMSSERRLSMSSQPTQPQYSPSSQYSALPHFPFAATSQAPSYALSEVIPEVEDYSNQYDQLLAAQRIQYQQIQLLQAQISANQLAQQQAQQQSLQMGIAPRFRALAEQRQAHITQQQVTALAQAQQVYEVQQQALAVVQDARQRAAQATLKNPPPVFEEDDDSPKYEHPQRGLNQSFSFGAKRPQQDSQAGIRVDRSQGIGGAEATGLAGLAARAHRRTGSELTPAMQQQMELQAQIEALQAKQKALMQEDSGSTVNQLNSFKVPAVPSQSARNHRRIQSTATADPYGSSYDEPSLLESMRNIRQSIDMPPPPVPSSHNRRQSTNVFAKNSYAVEDIPEDTILNGNGTAGHHRSGSRGGGFESGNWRTTSSSNNVGQVTDLASAQAQLQSLAQFRAAAGGGHNRMASFALPNMLPNLLAATTLSSPGGTNLWQQQQAFQMQLQQQQQSNSSGPQRKSLFAPYLPQASLPPLLQAGKLVVGFLRVNKKNRSDAYVSTDVLESDIYICGSKDRNRALEGDIVAVELLDVDEVWNTKKDKEEKKKRKEENSIYDLKPSDRKKVEKKKDDVEVEGQGLMLAEEELVDDVTKPMYAGHVVAVIERMPGQLFSGQLGVLRPSSAATKEKQELERKERGDHDRRKSFAFNSNSKDDDFDPKPKIVWFKPTDKRVPLIAIPTEQAPTDFIENPDKYGDRLFVATIKRWPITSLHPFGTLIEELGPIGDSEVETSALLKDCNFPTEEFGEATLKCLPPLPWSVPEREYEIREDLRSERIFTIDPPNAKDLDDALSIKKNDSGGYTVGVHIADVSYFVKPNTAIDREARKRGTSVYLVQRAVPMLPPQLSDELCSLQPGVERLAFSAFFDIDKDGNMTDKMFGRSIIKSCGKLSYATVQDVIEGQNIREGQISEGHNISDVEADIKLLHSLAQKLRKARLDGGAMSSDRKIKVSFSLNETGEPVDIEAYKRTDANSLVEEFMLLANSSVAAVIANGLPEQALLRRHEAPVERRIDAFVERARRLGFEITGTSAKHLQQAFDSIEDPETALCLELLKRKAMTSAKYFCTGMLDIAKYSHWALNTPLYTHFTSPIRRYADVIVHRMLDACLTSSNQNDIKFLMDRDQVAKVSQQCNVKKAGAKLAEEQSIHLHLCMLIHDLTEKYGPVIRMGRVSNVLDAAFDVVIPEFGVEKRVHIDKMPLDNAVYDEHKDKLSLYWTNKDTLAYLSETLDELSIANIRKRPSSLGIASPSYSTQARKSASPKAPTYEGLRSTNSGHKIQDVTELMSIPVIVTADMKKSPPVLMVYGCNPYAS